MRLHTKNSTVFEAHSEKCNKELSRFNIDDGNVKMCCSQIQSIVINSLYQCINPSCKRKVSPFPGENKVTCDSCKEKMLVESLIKNLNIELELQYEDTRYDIIVTVFQNVLKILFEFDELTSNEL